MTKPNINTKEGWNQFARETNTKSFIQEFGREPKNYEEVRNWVNAAVAEVEARFPAYKKPEPTLEMIGGELFEVLRF
jgi:hypothetical protein